MELRVRFEDPGQLIPHLQEAGPRMDAVLNQAVTKAAAIYQTAVRERTPVNTTDLRGSISIHMIRPLAREIRPLKEYAIPVELGTKPHWMPIGPLRQWVQRKLGKSGVELEKVARAIQFSISRKGTSAYAKRTLGTKGFRMFERGFNEAEPLITAMLSSYPGLIIERVF